MFGTYRTLLAIMVVFQHIGGVRTLGGYAVFGFYILSGYLMTLILHNSYGYSWIGFIKYLFNRILRIYPLYWVSCLLSVVLIFYLSKTVTTGYHQAIYLPENWLSFWQNFSIVFWNDTQPRLVPPAWALTVELFFYLCIGLGLSKNKNITLIWFALSVIYTIGVNLQNLPWEYKYYSTFAASLPFSTGAMIYFYRENLISSFSLLQIKTASSTLFGLIILNYILSKQLGSTQFFSFYINYILNALIIVALSNQKSLPLISKNLDKKIGDLSYSFYLLHYQAGLLLLAIIDGLEFKKNIAFAFSVLPILLLVSLLLNKIIEQPVEVLRKQVNPKK